MKNIKAYENNEVKLFSYEEINNAIKAGTDKEVLEMLQETGNLIHWQDKKKPVYKKLNLKHYADLRDKLVVKLKARLVERGYHFEHEISNWFNTTLFSIDDTSKRKERIQYEELLQKAFLPNGTLKEFARLISETSEITEDSINNACEQISQLEPQQLRVFLLFLKDAEIDFEEIQSINANDSEYITIETFHREYVLLTESKGEERARESLEDGEYWAEAVKSGNTTESKEDWIEDVINNDGWEAQINNYDGNANFLFGSWNWMRVN